MGLIWGRQDPGGPHVDPMKFAIWDSSDFESTKRTYNSSSWASYGLSIVSILDKMVMFYRNPFVTWMERPEHKALWDTLLVHSFFNDFLNQFQKTNWYQIRVEIQSLFLLDFIRGEANSGCFQRLKLEAARRFIWYRVSLKYTQVFLVLRFVIPVNVILDISGNIIDFQISRVTWRLTILFHVCYTIIVDELMRISCELCIYILQGYVSDTWTVEWLSEMAVK